LAENEICSDFNIAISWRWMLKVSNLIVIHDSLLPKYRGFSPLVNMLINGEDTLGVTVLFAT
jgi:methionyl-tRNA formyltransferase